MGRSSLLFLLCSRGRKEEKLMLRRPGQVTGDWQEEEGDPGQGHTGEWLIVGEAGSGVWMKRLRRRSRYHFQGRFSLTAARIHPSHTSCLS